MWNIEWLIKSDVLSALRALVYAPNIIDIMLSLPLLGVAHEHVPVCCFYDRSIMYGNY